MVFSQTSLNTQSILKVVELNHLKAEKNQQVNGLTGVVTGGISRTTQPSPMPMTSFTEVYLKSEPLYESTMFDTDYEFFQDLQWSFAPAKEEQVQTIDSQNITEERALQIDTPHTPFSPQGWDTLDANSSHNPTGFYTSTPVEPLSPNLEKLGQGETNFINLSDLGTGNNIQFQEKFLNLNSLPVVIGDLASEKVTDTMPWPDSLPFEWTSNTQTDYQQPYTNTQKTLPFMDTEEDSLDLKQMYVIPREVENSNIIISEYVQDETSNRHILQEATMQRRVEGLSVNVSAHPPLWPTSTISTPEVLTYVEQLEKEKCTGHVKPNEPWPVPKLATSTLQELSASTSINTPPPVDYEPITPKSECHIESDDDTKPSSNRKRRRNSEDSDESYTPYSEAPPRKSGRKRKPSVPIKDMILALEGSQTQSPVRRGRPPKRRVSTVSSVCSVDENCSSTSTQETKYRELRDKNNEASKRSRMNRKLKELQMEQLADELEEKNKNLRIRADVLENMTKRLKNELMTAILKK